MSGSSDQSHNHLTKIRIPISHIITGRGYKQLLCCGLQESHWALSREHLFCCLPVDNNCNSCMNLSGRLTAEAPLIHFFLGLALGVHRI